MPGMALDAGSTDIGQEVPHPPTAVSDEAVYAELLRRARALPYYATAGLSEGHLVSLLKAIHRDYLDKADTLSWVSRNDRRPCGLGMAAAA